VISIIGLAAALVIPGHGWEPISFGWPCLLLSIATIIIVAAIALYDSSASRRPLLAVGVASYSIYLLHPIFRGLLISRYSPAVVVPVAAILTIAFSIVCYRHFGKPFIAFGKRLNAPQRKVV